MSRRQQCTSEMEESSPTCAACPSKGVLTCGSCLNIRYCTKEHQRLHWSEHKHLCRSFKIDVNNKLGRFMVATRNLKAGELILRERALICGPKEGSTPLCLTCYTPLEQNPFLCAGCNIPFCSELCTKSAVHGTECQVLSLASNRVKISEFNHVHGFYDCILPLRCLLLKESEPQKYQMMRALEDHIEDRRGTELWAVVQHNIVNFLRDVCHMEAFDDEVIHSTCCLLDVNTFEIKLSRNRIRGLYPQAAMMAHSCIANTNHVISEEDYQLNVYASVPIKKGEIIFLNYASSLEGTKYRRAYLRQSKFFSCECLRCADPTECATFLSALKCQECSKGWILPVNPIDDQSIWLCDKCSHEIDSISQSAMVDELKEELEAIDAKDVDGYGRFIERCQPKLHPNHFLMTSVRLNLIRLYGHDPRFLLPLLSDKLLQGKIDMCESLLSVVNVLEPGYKRLRGSIIYETYAPLCILIRKSYEANQIAVGEFKMRIAKVCRMLEEAAIIFSVEDGSSSESRMGTAMQSAHAQLLHWIETVSS